MQLATVGTVPHLTGVSLEKWKRADFPHSLPFV